MMAVGIGDPLVCRDCIFAEKEETYKRGCVSGRQLWDLLGNLDLEFICLLQVLTGKSRFS